MSRYSVERVRGKNLFRVQKTFLSPWSSDTLGCDHGLKMFFS
jgi:hypothetical protein